MCWSVCGVCVCSWLNGDGPALPVSCVVCRMLRPELWYREGRARTRARFFARVGAGGRLRVLESSALLSCGPRVPCGDDAVMSGKV